MSRACKFACFPSGVSCQMVISLIISKLSLQVAIRNIYGPSVISKSPHIPHNTCSLLYSFQSFLPFLDDWPLEFLNESSKSHHIVIRPMFNHTTVPTKHKQNIIPDCWSRFKIEFKPLLVWWCHWNPRIKFIHEKVLLKGINLFFAKIIHAKKGAFIY